MTLNRLQAPAFNTIDRFELPSLKSEKLTNNIPVYYHNSGSSEVIKLEVFVENGGQLVEKVAAQSNFCIRMLTEGTTSRSSEQIQEEIARSGGFIELNPGSDRSSIVLYSLSRQLPSLLPVVLDLLQHAVFPEKELENLRNISLQGLKVNLEKTAYLASVKFRELIFGAGHPYAFNQTLESVSAIQHQDLIRFYEQCKAGSYRVFLSGKFNDSVLRAVCDAFSQLPAATTTRSHTPFATPKSSGIRTVVEKQGNMQCSLRVGRRLFTSTHADYFPFVMMNEILGGYFGSRLMQNLREEKGLTYGVNSNVVSYEHEGFFIIGTDIKKSDAQLALDEIRKEIRTMQTVAVDDNELETVRNYMLGSFVNNITSPFAVVDKTKTLILNNLPADYYQNYFSAIKHVSAAEIMHVANQYLKEEELVEVVGGSLE